MKYSIKIIFLYISIVITLSLSSCLKNNPKTFTFGSVSSSISQLNSVNFLNLNANGGVVKANLTSYFMTLRIDSSGSATDSVQLELDGPLIGKDINVTVGIDTTNFNKFNNSNNNSYLLLPSNSYTIPNNTAVIKASTRNGVVIIKFNTKQIDFSKNYVLPIIITDASGYTVSGNFGSTMYSIIEGNQYMGLYQSVGTRIMGSNSYPINDLKYLFDLSSIIGFQGSYPTAGGNGAVLPVGFVGNKVVANAADQTVYLTIGQQMDLTVNPDNSVTVSNDNLYGFGVQTYTLLSGTSSYDPVNHVFHLSYGFIDGFTGDSSVVSETMTRIN